MSDPSANAEQLELIVAYLDGELTPEESARVERQLAANEHFRRELQAMERAWTALDELPRTIVDDKFSHTTMELAVGQARREVEAKTIALPVERRKFRLSMALAGAAAACLGALLVRGMAKDPNARLLADLPAIYHVDGYSQLKGSPAEETEFLKLVEPQVASLVAADFREQVASEAKDAAALDVFAVREAWLAGLPDAARTALLYKTRRFAQLSADERARMRKLHESIADDPSSMQLRETLQSYGHWLGNLPQAQQFELRQMAPPQRAAAIKKLLHELGQDQRLALTDQQLRNLARVMNAVRGETAWFSSQQLHRRSHDRMSPAQRREMFQRWQRELTEGDSPPAAMYRRFREALPDPVRAEFDKLEFPEKIQQIRTWQRQARALAGEVSEQELERFFAEEIDAEAREDLLKLSPEDMRNRLKQLYRQPDEIDSPQRSGFGPPRDRRDRFDRRRPDGPARGFGPPRGDRLPAHDRPPPKP